MFSSDDPAAESLRKRMVRVQLKSRGIRDARVLEVMSSVPREEFVELRERAAAYEDRALPIEAGQTISQPYTVAFMCEMAQIRSTDRILEIGTGSGYGAAVLSRLGAEVVTVERIESLATQAAERLQRLGFDNVAVRLGDGVWGSPKDAPFDAIVVTAGADSLPLTLLDQLNENGRIVIPIGQLPNAQTMYRFTLREGRLSIEAFGGFLFVPLVGACRWADNAPDDPP